MTNNPPPQNIIPTPLFLEGVTNGTTSSADIISNSTSPKKISTSNITDKDNNNEFNFDDGSSEEETQNNFSNDKEMFDSSPPSSPQHEICTKTSKPKEGTKTSNSVSITKIKPASSKLEERKRKRDDSTPNSGSFQKSTIYSDSESNDESQHTKKKCGSNTQSRGSQNKTVDKKDKSEKGKSTQHNKSKSESNEQEKEIDDMEEDEIMDKDEYEGADLVPMEGAQWEGISAAGKKLIHDRKKYVYILIFCFF